MAFPFIEGFGGIPITSTTATIVAALATRGIFSGATSGLSTQALVSFLATDRITVVAPASQDATLAGVGFVLRMGG